MKKKLVAVVLVAVCAWLWWPETPAPPTPAQQAQAKARACYAEAFQFCGSFWCARADYGRDYVGYEWCLSTCKATYINRCHRYPSLLR